MLKIKAVSSSGFYQTIFSSEQGGFVPCIIHKKNFPISAKGDCKYAGAGTGYNIIIILCNYQKKIDAADDTTKQNENTEYQQGIVFRKIEHDPCNTDTSQSQKQGKQYFFL